MGASVHRPETRRFTADEVWQMVEIGLLEEDEPYELLDGELLYVSPQGESHSQVVMRLNMVLVPIYGPRGYVVRPQLPVGGIVDSIPEPDLAVVPVALAQERPQPDQTTLLVEVGISSLRRDRRKGEIYAAAGAPVYWIVDVLREVVTVHSGPVADGTWREVTEVGVDGSLTLPQVGAVVPAASLLRALPPWGHASEEGAPAGPR